MISEWEGKKPSWVGSLAEALGFTIHVVDDNLWLDSVEMNVKRFRPFTYNCSWTNTFTLEIAVYIMKLFIDWVVNWAAKSY